LFWQPWNEHVNTRLYYPTITRVGTWMGVLNQIEDYDGAPVMENDLGEGAGGG
jgi:hypothetical protein